MRRNIGFQETTFQENPNEYPLASVSNPVYIEFEQIFTDSLCDFFRDVDVHRKKLKSYIKPRYKKILGAESLHAYFYIDYSSILPQFEGRTETIFDESRNLSEEKIISAFFLNDFIVNMPPRKKFSLKAKVVSVKKARPPKVRIEESR